MLSFAIADHAFIPRQILLSLGDARAGGRGRAREGQAGRRLRRQARRQRRHTNGPRAPYLSRVEASRRRATKTAPNQTREEERAKWIADGFITLQLWGDNNGARTPLSLMLSLTRPTSWYPYTCKPRTFTVNLMIGSKSHPRRGLINDEKILEKEKGCVKMHARRRRDGSHATSRASSSRIDYKMGTAATSGPPWKMCARREELWDFLTKSRQIGFVPPPLPPPPSLTSGSALLFGSLPCRPQ